MVAASRRGLSQKVNNIEAAEAVSSDPPCSIAVAR